MPDLDEESGSEEENFQSRPPQKAQRGPETINGKSDKATTEEEGPA